MLLAVRACRSRHALRRCLWARLAGEANARQHDWTDGRSGRVSWCHGSKKRGGNVVGGRIIVNRVTRYQRKLRCLLPLSERQTAY